MTDILAERFAALADVRDDGDWRDVRRRARPRRRLMLAATLILAGACVAAAIAAVGGWHLFDRGAGVVEATETVDLPDGRWTVTVDLAPTGLGGLTSILRNPQHKIVMTANGDASFLPRNVRGSRVEHLAEVSAYAAGGRSIVFGVAGEQVARMRAVAPGHRAEVATVEANPRLHARVWAVATSWRPRRLIVLGRDGRVLGHADLDRSLGNESMSVWHATR